MDTTTLASCGAATVPKAMLILVKPTKLYIVTDDTKTVQIDMSPKMFAALVEQVGGAMRQAAKTGPLSP